MPKRKSEAALELARRSAQARRKKFTFAERSAQARDAVSHRKDRQKKWYSLFEIPEGVEPVWKAIDKAFDRAILVTCDESAIEKRLAEDPRLRERGIITIHDSRPAPRPVSIRREYALDVDAMRRLLSIDLKAGRS
jgi:hypothetical protein